MHLHFFKVIPQTVAFFAGNIVAEQGAGNDPRRQANGVCRGIEFNDLGGDFLLVVGTDEDEFFGFRFLFFIYYCHFRLLLARFFREQVGRQWVVPPRPRVMG